MEELLTATERPGDGCVLLDLPLPKVDGKDALDWRRSAGLGQPVIVMSASGDIATAVEALKGGASDFIEKPFRKAVLIHALHAALSKPANGASADAVEDARERLRKLTPRERDVLDGLARGCPNKVIAYELGISPRTVEIHRGRMMRQLGVRSVSHALRLAFAAGLGSEESQRRHHEV